MAAVYRRIRISVVLHQMLFICFYCFLLYCLGPSINGLVTDGNTKLCCHGLVLALFQSTTAKKLILNIPEIIRSLILGLG